MPDREPPNLTPNGLITAFAQRPWLGDTLLKVLPLALAAFLMWPLSRVTTGMFGTQVDPLVMWALEMVCILPLALSRSRPGPAATIIAAGGLSQLVLMYGPGLSVFSVPLVVFACAKYGSRRASLGALGAGGLGALLVGAHMVLAVMLVQDYPYGPDWNSALLIAALVTGFCAAVVLVAWLFGHLAGRGRREREAIAEKNRLLLRERHQEARLAADAERMRIAREMHDIISHSMSAMISQADGGRYVLEAEPARARRAFETIGETGREALTELRRMLGVLREEDEMKTRPSPGVRDLPKLSEDLRASGLEVELNIAEAHLPELTEGAGLAVYRIVQEALTNTLRHGGRHARATVWLGVDYATDELVVDISDTGAGLAVRDRTDDDGPGSGLRGMAERTRLYGGRFCSSASSAPSSNSGPASAPSSSSSDSAEPSGFVVEARFPLDRVRSAARAGSSEGAQL